MNKVAEYFGKVRVNFDFRMKLAPIFELNCDFEAIYSVISIFDCKYSYLYKDNRYFLIQIFFI